ncbi:ABC transporter permease [Azospirillum canadense]|uniref:ABC transporter permease n=1 Tax=Azospirillum canadense TaxID=403962 RepID=UPI0022261698|nr:ABC transporter permease [Azospirillum canadense]MCW2242127.1 ribose/xylose/arabinose/galactoside ABC-type transport system permease subunit [Azospirillum canadense]
MTEQSPPIAGPGAGAASATSARSVNWTGYLVQYSNVLALVAILVVASILSPYFFSSRNIFNVLRGATMVGIVAVGMTYVILNRGIDLSVGSLVGLSAALTASFAQHGLLVAASIGLASGLALGLANGLMITALRLQPFIATLGMMIFARGLVFVYTGGSNIVVDNPTDAFSFLGSGYAGPIPVPVLVFIAIWAVAAWVLRYTVFGRSIYAVGANEEAARLSGINADRNKILVYCISGVLAAFAGVVMASRLTVGEPNGGTLYELDAIAAVLIGGTTFDGGVGSVHGTVLGILILAFLSNVLNLLNISPYSQMLLKGVIIVLAVVVSEWRKRK